MDAIQTMTAHIHCAARTAEFQNPRENPRYRLYYAALDADAAYHAELLRLFGLRAGDMRYTAAGTGAPGSTLRALHDEFMRATTEHIDDMRRAR